MTFDPTPFREEYPFSSQYLERPGGRLHFVDEGEGTPVVLVHGNPTWSFYWRNLIGELKRDHRCVAPDHLGMGLSDKPSDADYAYTLDSRVADLEALIEDRRQNGFEGPLTLIAHDWGGMIALAYATRHPEQVARLVLLNTAGFALPKNSGLPWQLFLVRKLPFAIPVRGFNAFSRGAVKRCVTRTKLPPLVRKAYLAPYDSWAHRIAVHRFVQDIPLGPKDPAWATVQQVSEGLEELTKAKPTLIVWGERDFVFDDAFLSEWRRRVPHAEYLTFADAGHYVLEDARQEVIEGVRRFLEAHPITAEAQTESA